MPWRKIETATKQDGTEILGWSKEEGMGVWRWRSRHYDGVDHGEWDLTAGYDTEFINRPTHWRPLPKAPKAK